MNKIMVDVNAYDDAAKKVINDIEQLTGDDKVGNAMIDMILCSMGMLRLKLFSSDIVDNEKTIF